MLSKLSYKLIRFNINFSHAMMFIPYKWDDKTRHLYHLTSIGSWVGWILVVLAQWSYATFLFTTFAWSFYRPDGADVFQYIGHLIYLLSNGIISCVYLVILHKRKEILVLFNQCNQYFQKMRDQYLKPNGSNFKTGCEDLMFVGIITTFVQPLSCAALNLLYPNWACYLSAYIPEEHLTWFILFLTLIPHCWVLILAWTVIFFVGFMAMAFVSGVQFLNTELRANRKSKYTKNTMRAPSVVIHAMRCLQVLTNTANGLTRGYILVLVNNLLMIYSVSCLVATIKFCASKISIPLVGYMALGLDAAAGTAGIFLFHLELGYYHEYSKRLLGSWNRCTKTRGLDRKILKKYLKSMRVLRWEMGDMGFFQKAASIRIVAKIVFYVNKVLMLTKGIRLE